MTLRTSILFKAVSLVLVVSLMQLCVFASPGKTSMPSGRLMMNGDKPILVNGNAANSGTTIFSGAQLQTPAGVEASINLASIGTLNITPDTDLTLTFDKENVNVQITRGNAFLSTMPGVKGSVTTPDGKSVMSSANPATPAPLSHKEKGWLWFAAAVVVVIIIVVVVTHDSSPSN